MKMKDFQRVASRFLKESAMGVWDRDVKKAPRSAELTFISLGDVREEITDVLKEAKNMQGKIKKVFSAFPELIPMHLPRWDDAEIWCKNGDIQISFKVYLKNKDKDIRYDGPHAIDWDKMMRLIG